MRATRDAYGDALLQLGATNPDVVVFDSDLARSTRTDWFLAKYPERHFNAGIAEANMVGQAAGMSMTGLIPFVTTYSIFIGRAYDQIRQAVCYGGANVKIVATHGGLSAGHDGGSHQGIEDLGLMSLLPGLMILSPADYHQAYQAVLAAADHWGPVYLRLSKFPTESVSSAEEPFAAGPARVLTDGQDIALVATGVLVPEAVAAAERLRGEGLSVCVVDVPTVKPLDVETLGAVADRCSYLVTVEEHSRHGGLFAALTGALAQRPHGPIHSVAMDDCFGQTGEWRELLELYGMTAEGIAATARSAYHTSEQRKAR